MAEQLQQILPQLDDEEIQQLIQDQWNVFEDQRRHVHNVEHVKNQVTESRSFTWRPSSSSSSSSCIITTLIISRGFSGSFFLLLLLLFFLLDSNKESNNLLGLDHVVLINLELIEDVVNLGLVNLVSPGHEGVLEHLDINLAALIVGHESLEDQLIGIVAVSGHFLLEHVDHAVDVAGSTDLAHQLVQLTLRHEDTNVVEDSTQVVLVQGAILVDIHQLEAVLVHLDLLLREATFILTLAHLELFLLSGENTTPMY